MLQQFIDRIRAMGHAVLADNQPQVQSAPMSVPLAAAALLLEVAYADHQLETHELDKIHELMSSAFALPAAEITTLIEDAQVYYDSSVGAQPLTRALTESWSESERFELLVNLWRVALVHKGIGALEEHRIRHLAELLYLSHTQFIAAKRKAREADARG